MRACLLGSGRETDRIALVHDSHHRHGLHPAVAPLYPVGIRLSTQGVKALVQTNEKESTHGSRQRYRGAPNESISIGHTRGPPVRTPSGGRPCGFSSVETMAQRGSE